MAATSSRPRSAAFPRYNLEAPRLWLVVVVLALVSVFNSLHLAPFSGFNPDESRWISRAHFLRDLSNPLGPNWGDRYSTRGQPPVGSYVTAIGLLVQGRDLNTNGPWNFDLSGDEGWSQNIANGNMPVLGDLDAARRTSAVLMALTTIVVFFIARGAVAWPAALTGALFFAIHPFTAYIGSIATADAAFALFVALGALAAVWFARGPTPQRAACLALMLGLGAGTKLSPLLVSAPLAVLGLGLLLIGRYQLGRWPRDRFSWLLLGMPVAVFAVFVVLYPYLWSNPIGNTLNLFQFRMQEMGAQGADWPVMSVPNRVEALRRVGENFSDRYSILGTVARAFFPGQEHAPRPPQIELALAIAGAVIWLGVAIRQGVRGPASVALLVLGSQVCITIVGMRSEFDRYHVPMALFGAVSIAMVAGFAPRWRLVSARRDWASRPRIQSEGMQRDVGAYTIQLADSGQSRGAFPD